MVKKILELKNIFLNHCNKIYHIIIYNMNDLLNYNLIGIGEFSHGIIESWQFRFDLLKYAMKNTNKNIIIFNEMSVWQAENIMNNTIWSIKDNKYIKHE